MKPEEDLSSNLLSPQSGLFFAPIRHHSPRCAFHLTQLIKELRPDCILIEGPVELNALLPMLQHPKARPPFAAYLHASTNNMEHCRCYYPLVEFSPEWQAITHAAKLKISARFIDLPYAARLTAENIEHFCKDPEPVLYAETRTNQVVQQLINSSGCRDFDEWWDRHFESGVNGQNTQAYFLSLLAFSDLLRTYGSDGNENNARETFMAAQIHLELSANRRCLVVCGAYHVAGICAHLKAPHIILNEAKPELTVGVHLIPYPMQRFENALGYAAGLPAPGFYQRVWDNWRTGANQPYQAPFYQLAAQLTRALRDAGLPVALPDASAAVSMALGLGQLRSCHAGRCEILESLACTLVKDPNDQPLFARVLSDLLAQGPDAILPPNLLIPPLLADVIALCTRLRLPYKPGPTTKKELDIYRSERHRLLSQRLHQLDFLGIPYASKQAGPNFVLGTDLSRVREIWHINWVTQTPIKLIEMGRFGASLAEAAVNYLLDILQQPQTNPAQLVLQVLVMGLNNIADRVLDRVAQWINNCFDPQALAQATCQLAMAYEVRSALGGVGVDRLETLLQQAFTLTCIRMPWLGGLGPEAAEQVQSALADLYSMASRNAPWSDAQLFWHTCNLLHEGNTEPRIKGCTAGILTLANYWPRAKTQQALVDALALAHSNPEVMGEYLLGFLAMARSWLLAHPEHIEQLSSLIKAWNEEEFLEALPTLRRAFTHFSLREVRQLATLLTGPDEAAELMNVFTPSVTTLHTVQNYAQQVDLIMNRWGISGG